MLQSEDSDLISLVSYVSVTRFCLSDAVFRQAENKAEGKQKQSTQTQTTKIHIIKRKIRNERPEHLRLWQVGAT